MKFLKILGMVTLAAATASAIAAVNFDPDSGTGFVGKGDVQTAFGWNNHQAQDNANAVSFQFAAQTEYESTCVWTTGPDRDPTTHRNTHTSYVDINKSIASDPRRTGQYTGWNLNGPAGTPISDGIIPVVGGPCPGNPGNDKTIESFEVVSSSGSGLYALFGTQRRLIWVPPAP